MASCISSGPTFQITYDTNLKQYQNVFPIFLHDRGVTPVEYQQTISQLNWIIYSSGLPFQAFKKRLFLTSSIGLLVFTLASISPIILLFVPFYYFFYLLVFMIASYVVYFGVLVYGLISYFSKQRRFQLLVRQSINLWLEQQNQAVYYSKGVQFIAQREPMIEYPVIQILVSQQPVRFTVPPQQEQQQQQVQHQNPFLHPYYQPYYYQNRITMQ